MYLLINVCRRDDNIPDTEYTSIITQTKEGALELLFKMINELRETYDDDYPVKDMCDKDKQIILKNIMGKGIWKWEWERRGSGDFFIIIKQTNDVGKYPTFKYNYDINKSVRVCYFD